MLHLMMNRIPPMKPGGMLEELNYAAIYRKKLSVGGGTTALFAENLIPRKYAARPEYCGECNPYDVLNACNVRINSKLQRRRSPRGRESEGVSPDGSRPQSRDIDIK